MNSKQTRLINFEQRTQKGAVRIMAGAGLDRSLPLLLREPYSMRSFLTALILLTTCAATAQVGFNSAFYPTSQGGQGLGIASGDFNRDGLPDIAVGTNGAVNIYM